MAATSDVLKAYDYPVAKGKNRRVDYGYFTWFLIETLAEAHAAEAHARDSWADIMETTRAKMKNAGMFNQTPQLEGDVDRKIGLLAGTQSRGRGAAGNAPRGRIALSYKDRDRYELPVGLAMGIRPGAQFLSEKGTELEVTEVEPYISSGKRIAGPEPEIGDLFEQTHFVVAEEKFRVAYAPTSEKAWAAWIRKQMDIEFRDYLVQVEMNADPDWILHLVRRDPNDNSVFNVPASKPDGTLELWLTDANGQPMVNGPVMIPKGKPENANEKDLTGPLLNCIKRQIYFNLEDGGQEPDFEFTPIYLREGKVGEAGPGSRKAKYVPYEGKPDNLPLNTLLVARLKNLTTEDRYFYV
ncbi:MAG: hypothetical protein MI867_18215, partial [Pseudomonadales bacterium]|nr:hypothetical protein [Pseudomonadales bacterium]